ncbi:MAG: hypothetical protein H6Q05_2761, partial [Acidobacteria bacterium]|nr:hypothetical protein [Acidobacteriota bacterium]
MRFNSTPQGCSRKAQGASAGGAGILLPKYHQRSDPEGSSKTARDASPLVWMHRIPSQ